MSFSCIFTQSQENESKVIKITCPKAGTINWIIDYLIDKFHKNDYHCRFANNRSFNLCGCYFTIFTLSIQTPHHTSSKI